jgi:NADH dehydrogenase FAD-containing subunit
MKKILILGGGMGGVEAAIALAKQLKGEYQIDLISNRDFLYIYPASIWLTVGKRTLEDLSLPLLQLAELHGFNFIQAEVKEVKAKEHRVITTAQEHDYDYLAIALGGSKLKPPGVEHTLSICGAPSDGILFADDTQIATDLTVFTPGMTGNPILQQSDLPLTPAGFVIVKDTAQVEGFEDCYAIGDSSYFEGPAWRARQGHLAEVMARIAAENIARQERGEAPTATFREELNLLCIMDTGKEGLFIYRDEQREITPKGAWAHWAKLAWEKYYKLNKLGKMPRLL